FAHDGHPARVHTHLLAAGAAAGVHAHAHAAELAAPALAVLDLDAAHDHQAAHDQRGGRLAAREPRGVLDAAHDRRDLGGHAPVAGHDQPEAAPPCDPLGPPLAAARARAGQVRLDAAHHRRGLEPEELLRLHLAHAAAHERERPRIGGAV